jgi:hypothetical protein
MRSIKKPAYAKSHVYLICVGTVTSPPLTRRLKTVLPEVEVYADKYEFEATRGTLQSISTSGRKKDHDLVTTVVTRGELRALYTDEMVPVTKSGRTIYNAIRASAPLGKCPTCGFGHVYTVDHFLPHSKYPWYSVYPSNLIPACRDCNLGKLASSSLATQSFHPYYDHVHLMTEQWIYARVLTTTPPSIEYFVSPPNHWPANVVDRAKNHFLEYKLEDRFAKEAATELAVLKNMDLDHDGLKFHLSNVLNGELKLHVNAWRVAMCQAVLQSQWALDELAV